MKKFFSAILLMAAMAFSVSTFVSCNDLIEDVEKVTDQAGTNAEAIAALKTQVANLETSLASANAAIDAAKKAADAAAEAAATAKKEAIEEALAQAKALLEAEVEDLQAQVDALESKINGINGIVTDPESGIAAINVQIAALQEYLKFNEGKSALIEEVIAELEALKGKDIDGLKAKVDELVAKVDKNLVTILEVVAAQVQSLTYVPDDSYRDMDLYGYSLGEAYNYIDTDNDNVADTPYEFNKDVKKTPLMFRATYEVSPKAAVANIKAEDLVFVSVPTKVIPAFEIENVEIVDRDVNSGRFEVRAKIEEGTEVYHIVTKNVQKYNQNLSQYSTVNVALNVKKANVVDGVDVGTYVSSEYTPVYTYGNLGPYYNVYNYFKIYDGYYTYPYDGNPDPSVYVPVQYENEITVAWDTPIADSKTSLFPVLLTVNLPGEGLMTVEDAAKFTGFDLDVQFVGTKKNNPNAQYITEENSGDDANSTIHSGKKISPIVLGYEVEGDYFSAYAQLQESPDYVGAAANGQYVKVTLAENAIQVNGVYVGVTAKATYSIGQKGADIVIGDYNLPWSYKNGKNLPASINKELSVSLPSEITSIKSLATSTQYFQGYKYNMRGQLEKVTGLTADVDFLSSTVVNLVKITGANYKDEAQTYVFMKTYEDIQYGSDATQAADFTAAFTVNIAPMPKNKTINLTPDAPIVVNASTAHAFNAPVSPLTAVLPEISEFNGSAVTVKDLLNPGNTAYYTTTGTVTVKVNGEPFSYTTPDYAVSFNPVVGTQKDGSGNEVKVNGQPVYEEQSNIKFNKAKYYDDFYKVTQSVTVCGVVYTFVADVQFAQPDYKLVVDGTFVEDNNVVNLGGDRKLPEFKTGVGTEEGTNFTLQKIDLRNYVKVLGETNDDKSTATPELELVYTVDTKIKNNETKKEHYGGYFGTETIAKGTTSTAADATMVMTWNEKDDVVKYNDEVVVTIKLQSKNGKDVDNNNIEFGTQTITLKVSDFIKTEFKPVSKAYQSTSAENKVNIAKGGVKVFDAETGKVLYNEYAETLSELFDGSSKTSGDGKPATPYVYKTDTDKDNWYAIYGQTVTIDKASSDKTDYTSLAKAYVKSTGEEVPSAHYTVNATTGEVAWIAEDAKITSTIVIKVPVTVKHPYGKDHSDYVEVEFTK